MKFFQEITPGEHYPNHVYMLSDSKEFMYGYVKQGSDKLEIFKSRYRFGTTGRKFREVPNIYGYIEKPTDVPRWEFTGSKGDKYVVEKTETGLTCSCSGFRFRGKCKHVEQVHTTGA